MPSGGFRPGAGRPRKNADEKKLEGRAVAKSAKPVVKPITKPAPKPKVCSVNVMADYSAASSRISRQNSKISSSL